MVIGIMHRAQLAEITEQGPLGLCLRYSDVRRHMDELETWGLVSGQYAWDMRRIVWTLTTDGATVLDFAKRLK